MKATGIVRKIDSLGRVVLPKEIRNIYNLNVNDTIEIFVEDDEQIILKKYDKACIFCKKTKDIIEYEGKSVCKNCLKKLNNQNKET